MTHFNPAFDLERTFAIRTRIAFHHIAEIHAGRLRAITPPVHTGEMFAVLVGATHKIHQGTGAVIDIHRNREPDRTQRTGRAMRRFAYSRFAGKTQRGGNP